MTDDAEPRLVIDKRALVPIGTVVSCIGVSLTLGMWMSAKFESLETSVDRIDRRMERLEAATADRWTATDMRLWRAVVQQKNPALSMPEIRDIIGERK